MIEKQYFFRPVFSCPFFYVFFQLCKLRIIHPQILLKSRQSFWFYQIGRSIQTVRWIVFSQNFPIIVPDLTPWCSNVNFSMKVSIACIKIFLAMQQLKISKPPNQSQKRNDHHKCDAAKRSIPMILARRNRLLRNRLQNLDFGLALPIQNGLNGFCVMVAKFLTKEPFLWLENLTSQEERMRWVKKWWSSVPQTKQTAIRYGHIASSSNCEFRKVQHNKGLRLQT